MIVSNTTPISNFLHLGQMEIMIKIFQKIHIPMAVYREIEVFFSTNKQWKKYQDQGFIIKHKVQTSFRIKQFMTNLHLGEAEALCLCMEKNARLCLLDDKDARAFAKLNNIPVSGTLGVLVQSKKMGMIKSVKEFMDRLRTDHHYWVDDAMYKKVLSLSNEEN